MFLFWHDLRRLARRGRPTLGRIVLGFALLAVVAAGFSHWFPSANPIEFSTALSREYAVRLSRFAVLLLHAILWLQLAVVLVMTPVLCSGAIADERSNGTLDLLRMSHASPAAILLAKFAAPTVHLGSYLALCLPIMLITPLWGSFDI